MDENSINIKVSKNLYEQKAIVAASHKFTDNFFVKLSDLPDNNIEVCFKPKNEIMSLSEVVSDKFLNELLDQQMRISVERECGKTRDLIVEKAFSPLNDG